jgi:glucose-6-phosphate 1-dehydrogenase
MFEPVWNRNHIDHVQIDVPEELGIGTRTAFYEGTGALKDMLVTHLLQVLSVVAMEPPASLAPKALIDERVKVFDAMVPLRPADVVRGQFAGYRDLDGIGTASDTETFVAARVSIDNWRWAGVPFYLRTGKRLAQSRQTITLAFRSPPRSIFTGAIAPGERNHLTIELGSQESVSLHFLAQGARTLDRARPCTDGFLLWELVRIEAGRSLRTSTPRCPNRRPHPVHETGRHREDMGSGRRCSHRPASHADL